MSNIKVDLEFLMDETKTCESSLENLIEHIDNIKSKYKTVLENQKSNEFINEFEESMDEIVEQLEDMSGEVVKSVLESIKTLGKSFEEANDQIAQSMKG